MNREKGLAYCGLACCICSENETCAGCRKDGCNNKDWCKHFKCCKEKHLNGCWECEAFPCGDHSGGTYMHDKIRIHAFTEFIRRYGEEKLLNCLERIVKAGILYHYKGQLTGDYDQCKTVEEVIRMLEGNYD